MPKFDSKWWILLKYCLVLLLLASLLTFMHQVGFQSIVEQINKVGFSFIWILLCYLGGSLCASIAWRYCLDNPYKISLLSVLKIRLITESIALTNPTNVIGGDALKIFYLKKQAITSGNAFNSVLLSRIFIVLSQVVLIGFLALVYINTLNFRPIINQPFTGKSTMFSIIGIIMLILFLLLVRRWVKKYLIQGIQRRHYFLLRCRVLLLRFIKDFRKVALVFIMSLLHWGFGALELYLILYFIDLPIGMLDSLFLDTWISTSKLSGAFIPGQIGVEEYTTKWALQIIGIKSSSLWLGVALIRRAKQIFWILIGYSLLAWGSFIHHINTLKVGNIIHHS
jgi:hypothetical protein